MNTEAILTYFAQRVTGHETYLNGINAKRKAHLKLSPERIERAAVAAATMDVSDEYGVTMDDVIKAVMANAVK